MPPSRSTLQPASLLQPVRLSDRLAAKLRERIDSGDWPPGRQLPTEQRIMSDYGVSRTVVREAVSRLKSIGLLRLRQGSGMFVAVPGEQARSLAFDPAVLTSLAAVLHVVEVRRSLEGEIAALAAARITPAKCAAIEAALAAIDEAVCAGEDGVAQDLQFHRAIARATDNPQFERLLDFLEQYQLDAIRLTRANEAAHGEFMRQVRAEHAAIARAVSRGDAPAARRAAVRHMVNAVRRIEQADRGVRQTLLDALQTRARQLQAEGGA